MESENDEAIYNHSLAIAFLSLGFYDYIGARVLLLNKCPLQGVTLASTAIEKYIKTILSFHGRNKQFHLDKKSELKSALESVYFDVTTIMDDTFLEILSRAYSVRYVDGRRFTEPVSFGFSINQFLGELDYVIDLFENKIINSITDEDGTVIKTPYQRAIDNNNPQLLLNNYILNGCEKKEQMEKAGLCSVFQFSPKEDYYLIFEGSAEGKCNYDDKRMTMIKLDIIIDKL